MQLKNTFYSSVQNIFSHSQAQEIIVSLRQDKVVWDFVNQEKVFEVLSQKVGDEYLLWSPGFFALYSIIGDFDKVKEIITLNDYARIDSDVLRTGQTIIESIGDQHDKLLTLEGAAFLVLGLLQERESTGSWQSVLEEIYQKESGAAIYKYLKTAFTCLLGLLTNKFEFLLAISNYPDNEIAIRLLTYIINSTPMELDEQIHLLVALFIEKQIEFRMSWLRFLRFVGKENILENLGQELLQVLQYEPQKLLKREIRGVSPEVIARHVLEMEECALLLQLSQKEVEAESLLQNVQTLLSIWIKQVDIQKGARNKSEESNLNGIHIEESGEYEIQEYQIERYSPLKQIATARKYYYDNREEEGKALAKKAASDLISSLSLGDESCWIQPYSDLQPEKIVSDLMEFSLVNEAIEVGEELLAICPRNINLIDLLSGLYASKGDLSKAFEYADLSQIYEPDSAIGHRRLAELFACQENWVQSFEEWRKVLNNSNHVSVADWLSFAKCAYKINQPNLAVEACSIVLNKDSENAKACALMGWALKAIGQLDRASGYLERAMLINDKDAVSRINLAEILFNKTEYQKGIELLKQALKISPKLEGVYPLLISGLINLGNHDKALFITKEYLDKFPDSIEAKKTYVKTLLELGITNEADKIINHIGETWNKDCELASLCGQLLIASSQDRKSIPFLRVAINNKDNSNVLYENLLLLAKVIIGIGNNEINHDFRKEAFDEAQKYLLNALELFPDGFVSQYLLSNVYLEQGKYQVAYELMKQLSGYSEVQAKEWQGGFLSNYGLAAYKSEHYLDAIDVLSRYVETETEDIKAIQLLIEAYLKTNQPEIAINACYAFLTTQTLRKDLSVYEWFASLMAKLGKKEESLECWEDIVDISPDNILAQLQVCKLRYELGDFEGAQSILNQLPLDDDLPREIIEELSSLYIIFGYKEKAIQCLERIVNFDMMIASIDVIFRIALLCWELKNVEKGLIYINYVIDTIGGWIIPVIIKADLLVMSNDVSEAIEYLGEVVAQRKLFDEDTLDDEIFNTIVALIKPYEEKYFLNEAGLYFRLALLHKNSGNLIKAFDDIQKAYSLFPDNMIIKLVLLVLSKSTMVETPGVNLLYKDNNNLQELQTLFSKCEKGEFGFNEFILSLQLEYGFMHSRDLVIEFLNHTIDDGKVKNLVLLAYYPRVLKQKGNYEEAKKVYYETKQNLEKTMFSKENVTISVFQDYLLFDCLLWQVDDLLATTAMEIGLWQEALDLLDKVAHDNKNHAYAHFKLAQTYAYLAQNQYICDELDCLSNSPGIEKITAEYQEKYFNKISIAEKLCESNILIRRWALQGEIIYHPNQDSISRLLETCDKGDVISVAISGLRRLGDIEKALLTGRDYLSDQRVMIELSLCDEFEDDPDYLIALQEMMINHDTDPLLKISAAKIFQKTGDYERAFKLVEAALEIWPNEIKWHILASEIAQEMDSDEAKWRHINAALSLDPEEIEIVLFAANEYLVDDQPEKSIAILDKVAEKKTTDYRVWQKISQSFFKKGQLKRALSLAERATTLSDHDISPLLLCGEIAIELNQVNKAQEYGWKAFKQFPEDASSVLFLARTFELIGNYEKAVKILLQFSGEKSYQYYSKLVEISQKHYGIGKSIQYIEAFRDAFPKDIDVNVLLVNAQLNNDEAHKARNTIHEILKLYPGHPELSLEAAKLNKIAGQLDRAIAYLSEAIKYGANDINVFLELGDIYIDRRENILAAKMYERAISLAPQDFRAYYKMAVILKQSKDYLGAETMFRRAVELNPDDLNLRRQLGAVIALNLVHNNNPQEEKAF